MISRILLALGFALSAGANASPSAEIVGGWRVYKLIVDGVERPPFNPDLIIDFEFGPDQRSRLAWHREGESGFCERHGLYSYDGEILRDKITWVNPRNNSDCAADPDMQLGKEIVQPAVIKGGELLTEFPVDDQKLVFVWKRITSGEAEHRPAGDR